MDIKVKFHLGSSDPKDFSFLIPYDQPLSRRKALVGELFNDVFHHLL